MEHVILNSNSMLKEQYIISSEIQNIQKSNGLVSKKPH